MIIAAVEVSWQLQHEPSQLSDGNGFLNIINLFHGWTLFRFSRLLLFAKKSRHFPLSAIRRIPFVSRHTACEQSPTMLHECGPRFPAVGASTENQLFIIFTSRITMEKPL